MRRTCQAAQIQRREIKIGDVSATTEDDEPEGASDFNGRRKDCQLVGFRRTTTPSSVARMHGLKLVTAEAELETVEVVQRSLHLFAFPRPTNHLNNLAVEAVILVSLNPEYQVIHVFFSYSNSFRQEKSSVTW